MKSKLKNVLLMGLSFVLVAALAVGGTVAYLSDTDSAVNVMVLGNVKIAQQEYQRATDDDGNYKTATIDNQTSYVLEAFEQGKPLLPTTEIDANGKPINHGAGDWDATPVRMSQVGSYGGMQVFVSKNAQDKFVTVKNTGKSDAYVRTLVAIECGSGDAGLLGSSYHQTWKKSNIGTIEIDGNNYYLIEYVYAGASGVRHDNGILPAGDTTYPSLSQVYIRSAATNDDMVALDGNGNGTLDILVFSQAVQADGFANAEIALNAAFGYITVDNHPWAGSANAPVIPTSVSDVEELAAALAAGENVVLSKDVTVPEDTSIPVNGDVVIDLGGNTLTMNAGDNSAAAKAISVFNVANGQTLTIEGGEFVVNFGSNGTDYSTGNVQNNLFNVQAGGKLVINDGVFKATMVQSGFNLVPVIIDNNGEVVINGGSFSTTAINLFRNTNGKMTINGGTFSGITNPLGSTNYPYTVIWNQYANSNLTVNGGTFSNLEVEKEAGTTTIASGISLPLWVPASQR